MSAPAPNPAIPRGFIVLTDMLGGDYRALIVRASDIASVLEGAGTREIARGPASIRTRDGASHNVAEPLDEILRLIREAEDALRVPPPRKFYAMSPELAATVERLIREAKAAEATPPHSPDSHA